MKADAASRIEQELRAARSRAFDEAVAAAVRAAEGLIAAKVSPRDLDRMGAEYVRSIPEVLAGEAATLRGGA
jgi:F0F1-type ATP synthase membrane subunit b/b'